MGSRLVLTVAAARSFEKVAVVTIMGHADTRILRRYQEVVPEPMLDASARMHALLGNEG